MQADSLAKNFCTRLEGAGQKQAGRVLEEPIAEREEDSFDALNFSNDFINEQHFQKSKDFKQRLATTLNGLSNHCEVLQESKKEQP